MHPVAIDTLNAEIAVFIARTWTNRLYARFGTNTDDGSEPIYARAMDSLTEAMHVNTADADRRDLESIYDEIYLFAEEYCAGKLRRRCDHSNGELWYG